MWVHAGAKRAEGGGAGGDAGGAAKWRARFAVDEAQGAVCSAETVPRVLSAAGGLLHIAKLRPLSDLEANLQQSDR